MGMVIIFIDLGSHQKQHRRVLFNILILALSLIVSSELAYLEYAAAVKEAEESEVGGGAVFSLMAAQIKYYDSHSSSMIS